jgi:hypothetical protein
VTYVVSDRVKQTCTVIGIANIQLTTPVFGYDRFSQVCQDGDKFHYVVVNLADGAWETGLGTYIASVDQIARSVLQSSNNNYIVPFSSGSKEVFISLLTANTVTINDQNQLDLKNTSTINVKTPTLATDIVPKSYVDNNLGPLRTFNVLGTFSAPIIGTVLFQPITNVVIKRVQLMNSSVVYNPIVAQLLMDGVPVSSFTIPLSQYSATYTGLNISVTTRDYLSVNIMGGTINNFSLSLFTI